MSTEKTYRVLSCDVQASEARALLLIDPEAAIQRIEETWNNASTFYPSLLPTMQDTLRFAQGLLSGHRLDPLVIFGQDTFPSRRKH
jgi:hypothetical protein